MSIDDFVRRTTLIAVVIASFTSVAQAADLLEFRPPSVEQTVNRLATHDWVHEFALDRPPTRAADQSVLVFRWVSSESALGDPKAEWIMAQSFMLSRAYDYRATVESLLERSAAQGYAPARLLLARFYWNETIYAAPPQAKGLWLSFFGGSDSVDDLATNVYMGLAYECGRGVPKDLDEARKRLMLAVAATPPKSDVYGTHRAALAVAAVELKHLSHTHNDPVSDDICDSGW